MVIIDTSVWIDISNGVDTPQTNWYLRESRAEPLGLTELILAEVLQGTSSPLEFKRTHALLQAFEVFECANAALAVESARNYQLLRSNGITVRKTIDCFIATFCMLRGFELLHHDRDFDHFEQHLGLKVIRP